MRRSEKLIRLLNRTADALACEGKLLSAGEIKESVSLIDEQDRAIVTASLLIQGGRPDLAKEWLDQVSK